MKVTVCELPNEMPLLERAWNELVSHVGAQRSELVVLPEMPFHRWLAHTSEYLEDDWLAAVQAHEQWLPRLNELRATVVSTRPVVEAGKRLNVGYVKTPGEEARDLHSKYYLPDEPGFWEASWYQRGDGDFSVARTEVGNIGLLTCTELWFNWHAREYARDGIQLLICPRATAATSRDKWLAGGRAAAVVSGAFCLSSNLAGTTSQGGAYAGMGWMIEPDEGEVLGTTGPDQPFLTIDIDLSRADQAKRTYPRYVVM